MSTQVNGAMVARLLYLLHNNKELKIPKPLLRYIPGSRFITALVDEGIGASDVDPNMVNQLLEIGGSDHPGPGDSREAITIIQRLVDDSLRQDNKLALDKRLKIYRMLEGLKAVMSEQTVEIDLNDPGEITGIPKFDSGFQPLDAVLSGLYQGIFMLLGPPGSGKTSLMISMLETLRRTDWPGSLFMLENEIPAQMMKGRFEPLFRRTKFEEGDKLVCGPWNASHILDWVRDNPDPERVIFFDSADVMIGSGDVHSKKIFQEAEYLTLIEVKRLCRAVIVSSWPNRKDDQVTHFNQVSDAVEKIRYADAIVGINPMSNDRLQFKGLKNRFGPNGLDLTFTFNYETLEWQPGSIELESDFWGALQEEMEGETAATETNGRL